MRLGERGRRDRFGAPRGESLFCRKLETELTAIRNTVQKTKHFRALTPICLSDAGSQTRHLSPRRTLVCLAGGICCMLDAKGLLKRAILVAIISALPGFVNVVSAGRGGSGGSGGSSSSSSSGGHSSSGMSGGHSSTGMSGAHASTSTNAGHSATNSKGGRSAGDPSNVTQSGANHHVMPAMTGRSREASKVLVNRAVSTGETGQNIQGGMVPNEDWKRRHRYPPN